MYRDKSYALTQTHLHEEIHILDQTFTTNGPRAACGSLVLTVTTLRNKIDFF